MPLALPGSAFPSDLFALTPPPASPAGGAFGFASQERAKRASRTLGLSSRLEDQILRSALGDRSRSAELPLPGLVAGDLSQSWRKRPPRPGTCNLLGFLRPVCAVPTSKFFFPSPKILSV